MEKLIKGITFTLSVLLFSCSDNENEIVGADINTATRVSIDRFSTTAGHLMIRNSANGLPAANAPINFDLAPFVTIGLDRNGSPVTYYNFDIQPTRPSPIYVFFKQGESKPIAGQHNIVATIPGDATYNDFWLVKKVIVPGNYIANTITSEAQVLSSTYTIETTTDVVNCPIVPFGSTTSRSFTIGKASDLTLGWYNNQAVAYFNFGEAPLKTTSLGLVPTSPIYVMFNDNSIGPASGFRTETSNTNQTHNVLATSPGDLGYSPLWDVRVIDNSNFNSITNLNTAQAAPSMIAGANVNCPVVK